MVLAALLSLPPLAMGTLRLRIVAVLLLTGALALTFDAYPDAITEYTRYGGQGYK